MNKLRYIPGDLVYQKDDEGHWNIRSLSALNLALINYKDIKPIPLTSEILEKNGWRKTKIYYKLDLNNHQEVWAYENHDYTGKLTITSHLLIYLKFMLLAINSIRSKIKLW